MTKFLGQAQQGCADEVSETIEPILGIECIKSIIKVIDERIADETQRSHVTGENECNQATTEETLGAS